MLAPKLVRKDSARRCAYFFYVLLVTAFLVYVIVNIVQNHQKREDPPRKFEERYEEYWTLPNLILHTGGAAIQDSKCGHPDESGDYTLCEGKVTPGSSETDPEGYVFFMSDVNLKTYNRRWQQASDVRIPIFIQLRSKFEPYEIPISFCTADDWKAAKDDWKEQDDLYSFLGNLVGAGGGDDDDDDGGDDGGDAPDGCDVSDDSFLGDGYCDIGEGYNTEECQWDKGDCCASTCQSTAVFICGDAEYQCLDPRESGDAANELTNCPSYLDDSWISDGYCDGGEYNTEGCNWDGGDCCEETCRHELCGTVDYICLDPFPEQGQGGVEVDYPSMGNDCSTHGECPDPGYCSYIGCSAPCSDLCSYYEDAIDGICPCGGCARHSDCSPGDYCDLNNECWECSYCAEWDDAIDGNCPGCAGGGDGGDGGDDGCGSHLDCSATGYCSNDGDCYDCLQYCEADQDSFNGDCPCAGDGGDGGGGEEERGCQSHEDCPATGYCSNDGGCYDCLQYCEADQDSFNGSCPCGGEEGGGCQGSGGHIGCAPDGYCAGDGSCYDCLTYCAADQDSFDGTCPCKKLLEDTDLTPEQLIRNEMKKQKMTKLKTGDDAKQEIVAKKHVEKMAKKTAEKLAENPVEKPVKKVKKKVKSKFGRDKKQISVTPEQIRENIIKKKEIAAYRRSSEGKRETRKRRIMKKRKDLRKEIALEKKRFQENSEKELLQACDREFDCGGYCIPCFFVCDTYDDCPLAEDEMQCDDASFSSDCRVEQGGGGFDPYDDFYYGEEGECEKHGDCTDGYCDVGNYCYPCWECPDFDDAIDGSCPDCGGEDPPDPIQNCATSIDAYLAIGDKDHASRSNIILSKHTDKFLFDEPDLVGFQVSMSNSYLDKTYTGRPSDSLDGKFTEVWLMQASWKVSILSEVDPVDWGAMIGQWGGFFSYVTFAFGLVFIPGKGGQRYFRWDKDEKQDLKLRRKTKTKKEGDDEDDGGDDGGDDDDGDDGEVEMV